MRTRVLMTSTNVEDGMVGICLQFRGGPKQASTGLLGSQSRWNRSSQNTRWRVTEEGTLSSASTCACVGKHAHNTRIPPSHPPQHTHIHKIQGSEKKDYFSAVEFGDFRCAWLHWTHYFHISEMCWMVSSGFRPHPAYSNKDLLSFEIFLPSHLAWLSLDLWKYNMSCQEPSAEESAYLMAARKQRKRKSPGPDIPPRACLQDWTHSVGPCLLKVLPPWNSLGIHKQALNIRTFVGYSRSRLQHPCGVKDAALLLGLLINTSLRAFAPSAPPATR